MEGAGLFLLAWLGWASVPQAEGTPPTAAAADEGTLVRTWLESGPPERCVDVLLVGDGYPAADLAEGGRWWKDVERTAGWLLEVAPFGWYRARFNVRALMLESHEAGCDRGDGNEVDTALDGALDQKKQLRVRDKERLGALVAQAGGAELLLVLVNCRESAAGGDLLQLEDDPKKFLPAPTFSNQDEASFRMALHALGHSFAFLGDEFATHPSHCPPFPTGGLAPGGPNVASESSGVSLLDSLPWKHFLKLPGAKKLDWMEEGAGGRPKDSYRPWKRCLMRSLDEPFCPVCTEEIAKRIQGLCGLEWDDEAFHLDHPLKEWKP